MPYKWIRIAEYKMRLQAQIVKNFLEDKNINAVIVNKMDSAYGFGFLEIFVERDSVIRA